MNAIREENPREEQPSSSFDAMTPPRRRILELARRAARSSLPILILGPTGVGKDVLAADIHRHSPRAAAPFISINCAAITVALFESELFGHTRGAFTGASADKPGLIELAASGTLFLDEVGELPLEAQAKLLRFLSQSTYWPIGSTKERRADVRIIAATNRFIDDTKNDSFRQDLLYRLGGVTLRIPALEPGDILAIARSMTLEAMGRHGLSLSIEDIETITTHCAMREWRGGAREVRSAIERILLLRDPAAALSEHCIEVLALDTTGARSGVRARTSRTAVIKDLDDLVFLGLAEECHDVRELAQRTRRTVQAVYGRLKRLGLTPPDIGRTPALLDALRAQQQRIEPELPWIQSLLTR